MSISERQSALLATDRWAWLPRVLEVWYAEPLTAADGAGDDEIDAAVARVGPLPETLTEWFHLVGRRLRPVQDAPATPGTLWTEGDGIGVWTENQGVWRLLVTPNGVCVLDEESRHDDTLGFSPTPLPTALHAMVLSDTLAGVWAGHGAGPLGRLAPAVRGGMIEDEVPGAALANAYGELPVPGNPFWGVPPRGDAETMLRGLSDDDAAFEWMAASAAAFRRLDRLVPLDPPGGEQEVVLAFEGLGPAQRASLITRNNAPDTSRYAAALGNLGHLGMASNGPGGVRFHVSTYHPDLTVAALRAAIPTELTDRAVIAVRSMRISGFRVVFPAGRGEYVPAD